MDNCNIPALQARQVQEQQSAQANNVANKMAEQAADIRGLSALFEQVGQELLLSTWRVYHELGRNKSRASEVRKCLPA